MSGSENPEVTGVRNEAGQKTSLRDAGPLGKAAAWEPPTWVRNKKDGPERGRDLLRVTELPGQGRRGRRQPPNPLDTSRPHRHYLVGVSMTHHDPACLFQVAWRLPRGHRKPQVG